MATNGTGKMKIFSSYCYPKNLERLKAIASDYGFAMGTATEIFLLGAEKTLTKEQIQAVVAAGIEEKFKNKEPDGRTERSDLLKRLGSLTADDIAVIEAARAAKAA